MTTPIQFQQLVAPLARYAHGRALDPVLQSDLNLKFPPESAAFQAVNRACHEGITAGWLCREGDAKRRYGRIFEPGEATHGFSVDVVDITDLVGNHHRHPTGEIDMIMPVTPKARFDDIGAGWLVYPPGSGHRPTVTGGRALILYLLPEGKIEWTQQ
ncbi:MAG: 4-hydroxylaminobenzoate lyase [Burkholderiales bacterium]